MSNNGQTLDDKSVLLVVTYHKLGNSKKVSNALVEANADKTMYRVNKSLLDSEEYEAIKTHDGKTTNWLRTRALPSLLKEGIFRLPNGLIVETEEYLNKRAAERKELVAVFKRAYPKRVKDSLESLGEFGNINDYLTADEAAAKFGMEWKYLSFSTPTALKALKAGLFEREKRKIAETTRAAEEEIRQALRVSMRQLVQRMVTQLTPNAEGKRKKIYDSLTGNVEDFLDTFSARNIVNDAELDKLVKQARQVVRGVSASDLREMDSMRDTVRTGFEKIQKSLDKMIVEKPSRRFDFSE